MISRGMIKDLLISSGGKTEYQRIMERSNGALRNTISNPSKMLLTDAKARERKVVRKDKFYGILESSFLKIW